MQVPSVGGEDPLEEGMATHSSILAGTIPWTEEPGRLQSIGSHRIGHDWSDTACKQNVIKTESLQPNYYKFETWCIRPRTKLYTGFLSWYANNLIDLKLKYIYKCHHKLCDMFYLSSFTIISPQYCTAWSSRRIIFPLTVQNLPTMTNLKMKGKQLSIESSTQGNIIVMKFISET